VGTAWLSSSGILRSSGVGGMLRLGLSYDRCSEGTAVTELESVIPIDAQAQGMDDITPEQLAEVLSILTGSEFTPDGLLSNAHALMVLAPDDPRRERLYLAVLHAHEAAENGNRRAIIRHEMEFTVELLRLNAVSCQKGILRRLRSPRLHRREAVFTRLTFSLCCSANVSIIVIGSVSSRMDNTWTIGASHAPNDTLKHRMFNAKSTSYAFPL
jgi:hypothetical protein